MGTRITRIRGDLCLLSDALFISPVAHKSLVHAPSTVTPRPPLPPRGLSSLAWTETSALPTHGCPGRLLSERLEQIGFGEAHWRTYETLATDVLRYLFHPPLEAPQHNNWNFNGVDRRDIVLPNYATAGIWAFLRNQYRADFVAAEAKNYSNQVTKNEILQLANYLNIHGVGLFGLIITRHGANSSAEWTMRQQWMSYNKITVALNDDDLQEMLIKKGEGKRPRNDH